MEMSITGLAATRQTWRRKTVRELVSSVIAEHKGADEVNLRRAFREAVREDEEYFLAVSDYAWDAAFRALTEQKKHARPSAEQRAASAAASASRAAEHARVVKGIAEQVMMLNLEMPNGKRMRNCTGPEMAAFGKGYERIARKVGRKRVGEVLNEAQVREMVSR